MNFAGVLRGMHKTHLHVARLLMSFWFIGGSGSCSPGSESSYDGVSGAELADCGYLKVVENSGLKLRLDPFGSEHRKSPLFHGTIIEAIPSEVGIDNSRYTMEFGGNEWGYFTDGGGQAGWIYLGPAGVEDEDIPLLCDATRCSPKADTNFRRYPDLAESIHGNLLRDSAAWNLPVSNVIRVISAGESLDKTTVSRFPTLTFEDGQLSSDPASLRQTPTEKQVWLRVKLNDTNFTYAGWIMAERYQPYHFREPNQYVQCAAPDHGKKELVEYRPPTLDDVQSPSATTRQIKVLPIVFDPNGITSIYPYSPDEFSELYKNGVEEGTGHAVQYELLPLQTAGFFPELEDGFVYDKASYLACFEDYRNCHGYDGQSKLWGSSYGLTEIAPLADQSKLVESLDLCRIAQEQGVEEFWLFAGPYFGFHETSMIGREPFSINGMLEYDCPVTFATVGFNLDRHPDVLLHGFGHRVDFTLSHYGLLDQFAGRDMCGDTHFPPNGTKDYDYGNQTLVSSGCDSFFSGDKALTSVACDAWQCNDWGFQTWRFKRMPRGVDNSPYENWWDLVFNLPAP
ncbi:MAG: hypothetical protein IPJ88_14500 [Myxococcales bacterium]|nr:MAG: hypothetical protein IPJ88_14500 [Myxococcales bacterium]